MVRPQRIFSTTYMGCMSSIGCIECAHYAMSHMGYMGEATHTVYIQTHRRHTGDTHTEYIIHTHIHTYTHKSTRTHTQVTRTQSILYTHIHTQVYTHTHRRHAHSIHIHTHPRTVYTAHMHTHGRGDTYRRYTDDIHTEYIIHTHIHT